VNVPRLAHSVGRMNLADWAEHTARDILETTLPRRWAHSQSVAAQAGSIAPILGPDADLLTAAAWLHDIGYAPRLTDTQLPPSRRRARYLRGTGRAPGALCRLVAHHSCAIIEAEERGIAAELAREFSRARYDLTDALNYCDMTTGPDGQRLSVGQRLSEIRARYGPGHPVSRAISRSAPDLMGSVTRIERRMARLAPAHRPNRPAWAGVLARVGPH
jgi:HD domain